MVGRIEKSKVEGNFERNVIFAQRKRESASNKMVAFHLAWQPDYARFGIACPLTVLSRCGSAARLGVLSGEGNNAPAEFGDSLFTSQIFLV